VIAEALSELPRDDVRNLRLTAWFYRETKRWGDAFEIIALLDTRSSTPGSELLSFADGARASDQYDVALQAYDEVARRAKGANLVMTAAFGSVRTLELRLRVSASVPKVEAREIIRRYDEIIDRYGSNPLVADALYFSALLHDDVLREMEPARERLTRLVNTWRSLSRSVDGALKLADIYLAMGQDERALELLGTVVNGPTGLVADRADMARIRRADILAWNGDLDSAKVLYQPLAEASGSIASNDALDRMMLLNLAIDDSATVRAIVRADGFITRRRHLDAIRELDSIIPKIKDNDLRDRSLLMCARSCLFIADSARAAALLDKIINGNPDSIYGDRALWLYADITVSQNDSQRAIQLLEALLRNYPRSIIVPEARERIRRLRGDGR
jgi:tetratricopeptide (TPR) repeat protein